MDVSGKFNVNVDSKDAVEGVGKLIDAISVVIGTLNNPQHVIEMAKARKQAKILQAETKAETALVKAKSKQEIEKLRERMELRRQTADVRRQQNREAIAAQAALALPERVNAEKPDEDWIYQFFNLCEDIGNDEMQTLWGRLLAGEVAQPGSFSLRTLNTVKLFHRSEAELFTNICSYVWSFKSHGYILIAGGDQRSKTIYTKIEGGACRRIDRNDA